MNRRINKLTMLTLFILGLTSTGAIAGGRPKLSFGKITDVTQGYKNMTTAAKKAIAEHSLIWESKLDKHKFRDYLGNLFYIEPDSNLTGGTSTALEVFNSGTVKTSKIFLPDSEMSAKDIVVSKAKLHGVTRTFDNPTGEVEVTETYNVLENKLGKFRTQNHYYRSQKASGNWSDIVARGDYRGLVVYIGNVGVAKRGDFMLPDAIAGKKI